MARKRFDDRHVTTRRAFVATMGFGGISLYGLWTAYGAAPGPLTLLGLAGPHHDESESTSGQGVAGGGHAGHGADADGTAADEFRQRVAEFIGRFRMPDGSVFPRGDDLAAAPAPAADSGGMAGMHHDAPSVPQSHVGHDDQAAPRDQGGHDGHAMASADADDDHAVAHAHGDIKPIDVYLLAEKWFYEPAHLRLEAGVPYAFHMMAADISHGASIQFGRGGRIVRLRPNLITSMDVTFRQTGNFLVYCTVFCGAGHDMMKARIEVV